MYGFSFFQTSPYFFRCDLECAIGIVTILFKLCFNISIYKSLHIYFCDQRLGPFDVIKKFDFKLCKLKHHRGCSVLIICNCYMLSKSSIDKNQLQLITSLMLM